jgi:predicted CXXCH cytochrome family protein
MHKLSALGALVCSTSISGYLGLTLWREDKTVYLPGETSHGHYQIEQSCESCHRESGAVRSSTCLECHAEELELADDSHPVSKFLDPRNAQLLEVLDARECGTCHSEHRAAATEPGGATIPRDFCFACHADIAEERPTHAGLDHAGCQQSGCHNFHDNRALDEEFLLQHLREPALKGDATVPRASVRLGDAGPSIARMDDAEDDPRAVVDWPSSAHALVGVRCEGCHVETQGAQRSRVDERVCSECHEGETLGFRAGHHGMRLAAGLSPMRPALARLPMKPTAYQRELGCHSCHEAHAYDRRSASVASCLGCHDDAHSRAYQGSPHALALDAELRGKASPGSGVSCATCHLPAQPNRAGELAIEHNQNDNLRPNEKMVRSVCVHCHGVEFSLAALADQNAIVSNFRAPPRLPIDSMRWVTARDTARARRVERRKGASSATGATP